MGEAGSNMTDHQLLREYVDGDSEDAFAQLVQRHLGLVYGVAHRQVGDHSLASDVAQAVFVLLARKAARLKPSCVVAGWLFRTTRFVAARAVRTEQRRQHREQEALAMQELGTPDETWQRLAPELDEALATLGEVDRNALLLRFGEGRNHREVGRALGLGEEAAKKRTLRALEKLRGTLTRRGLALPAIALATAMEERLVASPPAGLLEAVLRHSRNACNTSGTSGTLVQELVSATRRLWWAAVGGGLALLLALMGGAVWWRVSTAPESTSTATEIESMATAPGATESDTSLDAGRSGRSFRLVVQAEATGEPIPGASIPVSTVVGNDWRRRDDLVTDEQGVCLVPLSAEPMGRLDVGVNIPGWIPRFFTWRADQEEPLPEGYTLRLRPATTVGGGVLTTQRQPIPDVVVWALVGNSGDSTAREPEQERLGFVGELRVSTTDARGRFTCIQIPESSHEFQFTFKHPDFVTTHLAGSGPEYSRLLTQTAEVILTAGAGVIGTIVDAEGQPIEGARVGTKHYLPQVVTTVEGSFELRPLAAGPVTLLATADQFAPKLFQATAGGPPVVVQLEPGGVLRVRFVDEAGEPIAGAWLALEHWGDGDPLSWRGTSDPEGRLVWTSAPPDQVMVFTAMAPGFTYARGLRLRSDDREETVTLQPARQVIGTVVDAETRQPIPTFRAFPGYGPSSPQFDRSEVRRGTHGVYRLSFSEAHGSWVSVEAEGYAVMESEVREIAPGEFRADFALRRVGEPKEIRGVVSLPDGTPAAGAQVALCTVEEGAILGRGSFLPWGTKFLTQADAQGRFTFPWGRAPHTVVAVSAAGLGRARVRDGQEPSITLQPFGRIDGRVSRDGEPVAGQVVQFALAMPNGNYRTLHSDVMAFQSRTDTDGKFTMEFIPPGDSNLYLSYGVNVPFTDRTPISVPPGGTLEVVMGERDPEGRDLVGRLQMTEPGLVTDWKLQARGSSVYRDLPVVEPPSQLSREEKALWEVDWNETEQARERERLAVSHPLSLGPDGSFRVQGVRPGRYQLSVRVIPAEFQGEEFRAMQVGGWTAHGAKLFEVPPPTGEDAEPVDLGRIEVRPHRRDGPK